MSHPHCLGCNGTGRERSYIDPSGRTQPTDRPCLHCCARCHNRTSSLISVRPSGWCRSCEDEARAEAIYDPEWTR